MAMAPWKLHIRTDLSAIDDVVDNAKKLTVDVCNFIAEVKNENSNDYPPGSLYGLVACLTGYVEHERPDLQCICQS